MASRKEDLIVMGAAITTLRAQIAELKKTLAAKEAAFELRLSGSDEERVDEGSLGDRIVRVLEEHGDYALTVDEIAVHLQIGEAGMGSLRAALARLAGRKMIERAGRGRYEAVGSFSHSPQVKEAVEDPFNAYDEFAAQPEDDAIPF